MTKVNTFNIEEMESLNPYNYDGYHLGQAMGTNCEIMFANFPSQECKYLIIINTQTGKRIKVSLTE